jgi:ribosomal protein S21
MINAEVEKNSNESNVNLIKRFTRKVQGAGILPRVRSIRYAARNQSKYVRKKMALKALNRRKDVDLQIKLGKLIEKQPRR